MSCEGAINIYDKGSGKLLMTVTCHLLQECLASKIWGTNGQPGTGIEATAANLAQLPQDKINASFNSRCEDRKTA